MVMSGWQRCCNLDNMDTGMNHTPDICADGTAYMCHIYGAT